VEEYKNTFEKKRISTPICIELLKFVPKNIFYDFKIYTHAEISLGRPSQRE
jgi:hypothetical protein